MERIPINPQQWGLAFGMNQAEIVEGVTRYLHCSGQTSLVADDSEPMGVAVTYAGNMAGQLAAALANVDDLLETAAMDRSNLLSLRFYTTDVDAFLEHYEIYAAWIGEAGVMPPQSLLGVARLALPELLIEVEVTAGA